MENIWYIVVRKFKIYIYDLTSFNLIKIINAILISRPGITKFQYVLIKLLEPGVYIYDFITDKSITRYFQSCCTNYCEYCHSILCFNFIFETKMIELHSYYIVIVDIITNNKVKIQSENKCKWYFTDEHIISVFDNHKKFYVYDYQCLAIKATFNYEIDTQSIWIGNSTRNQLIIEMFNYNTWLIFSRSSTFFLLHINNCYRIHDLNIQVYDAYFISATEIIVVALNNDVSLVNLTLKSIIMLGNIGKIDSSLYWAFHRCDNIIVSVDGKVYKIIDSTLKCLGSLIT